MQTRVPLIIFFALLASLTIPASSHENEISSHEDHGSAEIESSDQAGSNTGATAGSVKSSGRKGVRCVVCTSDPNEEGTDCISNPLNFVKECITPANSEFGNYTGCRKIEQWVDYDMNISDPKLSNHHRIIRQCAYFGMHKPCMHSANQGGKQYTCYCQGDACNGAAWITSAFSIIFPSVSLAVIATSVSKQLPAS